MRKKLTYEYVKNYFKKQGCELLEEEHKNAHHKMKYICNCGKENKISFANFKKGQRCKKCGGKKSANQRKYTFEFIYNYFKEQGCELLEKEYINSHAKMKYRCSCGNISKIKFGHFKNGHRCKNCCGLEKHLYSYIYDYFKNQGCELLEKNYINAHLKMKYRCNCGDIDKINFANFQNERRCKKCGYKKISGENHWAYNPSLTDEDRIDRRLIKGYSQWVKYIYKKDQYTCQKCETRKNNVGKYKKIYAHHIEGYAENKDLRLDKNNGITFCETCHIQFHKIYSKKNINRKQLEEFLK